MFTPITVPSRSSPETFATEAELAIAGLAQFILDYNQLGSILNTAITSTSTTSLAIGTGSKSLTVQTGLNLVPGYPVRLAYTTSPTDNMDGTVTTYNSSTGALVVNVASVNGSGTYANWQVMVLPSATGNFADKSTANTFTDVQTFTGGVAANPLIKKQSDPTLGGALLLEKSSGSELGGNLKFELSGNSIRIYENGGSNRGVTLDLTNLAASIADKILTTASLKNATNDPTFSSTSGTDAASPEWVIGKALIKQGAVVTTNGAAAYDFAIPSGAKRFGLKYSGIQNSGVNFKFQLGASSIEITGYTGSSTTVGILSTGFDITNNNSENIYTGKIEFDLLDSATNTYIATGIAALSNTGFQAIVAGSKSLSGEVATIRLTSTSGNMTGGKVTPYWEF